MQNVCEISEVNPQHGSISSWDQTRKIANVLSHKKSYQGFAKGKMPNMKNHNAPPKRSRLFGEEAGDANKRKQMP